VGERQGDNNAGGAVERFTITEAATLLGCHRNTIKNRIQAGMYRAEKVLTENGPTWMIDRDSLTNNAPTSARQQAVSGVPSVQQEAIQELARAIVREAGIAQNPEVQARLEGNKLAAEAAKTLVLVGSGLLVGMTAVVGIMPTESRGSPLLYLAFTFVFLAIFSGFVWMREISEVTASAEGDALGGIGTVAMVCFVLGVGLFLLYTVWSGPMPGVSIPPGEQVVYGVIVLVLAVLLYFGAHFFNRWRKRRRSRESEPPSDSA